MHNGRMKASWPVSLWNSGRCDSDTRELESARNRALARLTEMLKPDDPLSSIIAVSGSHQSSEHDTDAENLGKVIAEAGYHLTTGGLGGIMLKAAEGFCKVKRRSSVIGILPMGKEEAPDALKQVSFGAKRLPTDLSGFDRAGHKTHIGPSSRHHVLIYGALKVVCMPGGAGSIAEAELAHAWYGKPAIAYFDHKKSTSELWLKAISDFRIHTVDTLDEVRNWLRPPHEGS